MLETVLKDNEGKRIQQGQIHREIQWHIDECKRRQERYCGVLAPWGHGKTENVIIGRTLDEVGKNHNIRTFVVSNTDENAKARIESITNYINNDPDYKTIYPGVKPADEGSWSKHKIIVQRESRSKDGTVEAYGVGTSGVGGRCDLLLFDDPVDMRNAISNPALREQIKANIENVWLSRLTPEGMAIYIATIWHQSDATSYMMKNPAWKFLVMRISDDFEWIECDSPFKGRYRIPVWEYWNKARLIQRFKVIGMRAFNRGFRQQALSDEDRTFPSSEKIFRKDVGLDVVMPDWPRVIGVDPFGQQVVLFVIAYNPQNHVRFPIDIIRGKFSPQRTVAEIVNAYQKHRAQLVVCENNASQEAIVQWVSSETQGKMALPIVPFTTGKQKADPAFGLPSVEVEFANGAWCVPYKGIDEYNSESPINVWRKELLNHPLGEAADTVMAMWFAREGIRYLTLPLTDTGSNIISGEEMGIEQVVIQDNY